TAVSFTSPTTGAMMNRLRNSARPASTWFGGTPVIPNAFRVSASTTKILVKLVIISSSDGATESKVMVSRTTTGLLGVPSMPLMSIDTVGSPDGGAGSAGATGALGPTGSTANATGPAGAATSTGPAGAATSTGPVGAAAALPAPT